MSWHRLLLICDKRPRGECECEGRSTRRSSSNSSLLPQVLRRAEMMVKPPFFVLLALAHLSLGSPLLNQKVPIFWSPTKKTEIISLTLTLSRLVARRGGWTGTRWTSAACSSTRPPRAPTGAPATTSASLRREAPWQKLPPRYNSISSGRSWPSSRWRGATSGGPLGPTWAWTALGSGPPATPPSATLSGARAHPRPHTALRTAWFWAMLWILWGLTRTVSQRGPIPSVK